MSDNLDQAWEQYAERGEWGKSPIKDKLDNLITQDELKKNPQALQKAIAKFPISVAKTAMKMMKTIELRERDIGDKKELDDLISLCEKQIRDQFREIFGKEIF